MECKSQTFRARSTFDLNDDSMVMSSGEIKLNTFFLIISYYIQHTYHKNDKHNQNLPVLTASPASTKSEPWEMRKTEGFVPTEYMDIF